MKNIRAIQNEVPIVKQTENRHREKRTYLQFPERLKQKLKSKKNINIRMS